MATTIRTKLKAVTHRALLIGVPGGGINVSLAAQRLTPVLRELGFGSVAKCSGHAATRPGILAALDRLIAEAEPGDPVFIHYFGHGGRVEFTDLEPDRVFGYVTCTKAARGGGFEGVLDLELSARLTALDARCGNVTVMLDCCFSGELVRSGEPADDVALSTHRREPGPDWAREVLAAEGLRSEDLALDSHPGIVRLCGASAKREAFAAVRGGRHIGRLTEAFIAAMEEAGSDWDQLCWATLGHRLREHVVVALEMEGQWVALAGPRTRRLFSTETVALPGTVAFVPGDAPGQGWIRAGWHQGVGVGDRWALVDPRIGPGGEVETLTEVTVTKVGRNRAQVEFEAGAASLRPGTPAAVAALAEPMVVDVAAELGSFRETLGASAWLRVGDGPEARARVGLRGGQIVIEVGGDDGPSQIASRSASRIARRIAAVMPSDAAGRAWALAVLEDRARVHVLGRSLAAGEASDCPVTWTWSRVGDGSPEAALPEAGAVLRAGERIRIDLALPADAPPLNWFVSVVLIDPAGRPRLLSTRMPEGIELAPGDAEVLGVRLGRRGAQGIELRWPRELEGEGGPEPRPDQGPASLLFLASRRPIELAHIVAPQALDEDDALALQGLAGDTLRDRKPEHTRACAWARIPFQLRR